MYWVCPILIGDTHIGVDKIVTTNIFVYVQQKSDEFPKTDLDGT